jgi:hypothetical protein
VRREYWSDATHHDHVCPGDLDECAIFVDDHIGHRVHQRALCVAAIERR